MRCSRFGSLVVHLGYAGTSWRCCFWEVVAFIETICAFGDIELRALTGLDLFRVDYDTHLLENRDGSTLAH